jgi:hypothetical protein
MFGPILIRIMAGITFIARPIKPRIRSAEAKVGSVDIISLLLLLLLFHYQENMNKALQVSWEEPLQYLFL